MQGAESSSFHDSSFLVSFLFKVVSKCVPIFSRITFPEIPSYLLPFFESHSSDAREKRKRRKTHEKVVKRKSARVRKKEEERERKRRKERARKRKKERERKRKKEKERQKEREREKRERPLPP